MEEDRHKGIQPIRIGDGDPVTGITGCIRNMLTPDRRAFERKETGPVMTRPYTAPQPRSPAEGTMVTPAGGVLLGMASNVAPMTAVRVRLSPGQGHSSQGQAGVGVSVKGTGEGVAVAVGVSVTSGVTGPHEAKSSMLRTIARNGTIPVNFVFIFPFLFG